MSRRQVALAIVGLACALSCAKKTEPVATKEVSPEHAEVHAPGEAASDTFDVKVFPDQRGVVFNFRFGDRRSRTVVVNNLTLDRVGADAWSCNLTVLDWNEPKIEGEWVLGSVPANFRAQGCKERRLSAGDYELSVSTQRGDHQKRIHVDSAGMIDIRPWEDIADGR